MNFTHSSWIKRAAAMFVLATASLLVMTATSFAQGHSQRHERRDQQQERYYNNGGSYGNGHTNNGYNNNGGYYNSNGHANNGHNNGGYYNGNGHANNGYNNNGGYYNRRRPHYDSGSFGNRLHHAFGGH